MNSKIFLISICINFILITQTFASISATRGSDLMNDCQTALLLMNKKISTDNATVIDTLQFGNCTGYLQGITDMAYFKKDLFCIPDRASIQELTMAYVKYMHQHPQLMHETAIYCAIKAFSDIYPCNQKKKLS